MAFRASIQGVISGSSPACSGPALSSAVDRLVRGSGRAANPSAPIDEPFIEAQGHRLGLATIRAISFDDALARMCEDGADHGVVGGDLRRRRRAGGLAA